MAQLSESEIARLASFPEQNPNPVIEILSDGTVTYLNPAAQQYFPDMPQKQIAHPLFNSIRNRLPLKKNFRSEVTIDEKVFEQKIFFIPDTDLIRVYSHDISEMKLIEKNLSRLASFPEQNPSPIIEVDLEKNITYFNPACLTHFPEILLLKFEHQVLDIMKRNFEKFVSGELTSHEEEIKVGERYYAQRMRIMKDASVIRMFNLDITSMKNAEEEIKEKNKSITDSINYAKKIQESILPPLHLLKEQYPNSFVFYQPKDIVSGDFYWLTLAGEKDNVPNDTHLPYLIVAAADCTGHGVPGALMSMLGSNLLSHIVLEGEIKKPNEALSELDKRIKKSLKQEGEPNESKDGMDIALCSIHKEKGTLHYSGANRPLLIIREGKLLEIASTKLPIGGTHSEDKVFQYHKLDLQKGDCIYMFTDGFADQFGGPKGKKYMKKQFYDLLLQINSMSMQEQKEALSKSINNWKGAMEQTDDILVIGIKHE